MASHKILLKKARTQTINKLVHKLRKIQQLDFSKKNELEQSAASEKNRKKVNKLCQTLEYLKVSIIYLEVHCL